MRNTFAKVIREQAEKNKRIVLLSGDIGNKMFDEFKKTCPKQFLNCGIAEANMMSMASGMALCGIKPVIYTITPFTTLRCFEQIKIGVGYHNVPVLIVGTGSGLSYAELGPTHHSLEDIAIIRTIPGLNILTPCDSIELSAFIRESLFNSKLTYIRIGKKGEPNLCSEKTIPKIGKANMIKEGRDILILGIGPIICEALQASKNLKKYGIDLAIASMGSVRPIDCDFLEKAREKKYKYWITLEEHGIIGGLGSTILEWISEMQYSNEIKLHRLGVPSKFINKLGNQSFVRNSLEIDSEGIKKFLINL